MSETILIVDDEESVRRTFEEWLQTSGLDCRILAAADAEAALRHANRSPIDLAVLDWNLGAGNDGLQLLQDLSVFHPDIVAILVTGYAHQATPLDALRMGVRDYLDKNQGLNRETFLAAIRKQLTKIVPAKRHRELHSSLAAFRSAVEKVLPLVQSAAALNDPVPLPRAIAALSEFLRRLTGDSDAVLLLRHVAADGEEQSRAWNATGEPLEGDLAPFARSLAAAALSQGDVCLMNNLSAGAAVELQPFERARSERSWRYRCRSAAAHWPSWNYSIGQAVFGKTIGNWPRRPQKSAWNCSGKRWPTGKRAARFRRRGRRTRCDESGKFRALGRGCAAARRRARHGSGQLRQHRPVAQRIRCHAPAGRSGPRLGRPAWPARSRALPSNGSKRSGHARRRRPRSDTTCNPSTKWPPRSTTFWLSFGPIACCATCAPRVRACRGHPGQRR